MTRVCWIRKALRLVETAWDKRQPGASLYGESLGPRYCQDQLKMCSQDLIGVELQEKVCQNCVKQRVVFKAINI